MNKLITSSLLILTSVVLALPLRADDTKIIDNFGLTNRQPGSKLDGTLVEIGGVEWKATSNMILSGSDKDGSVSIDDTTSFCAKIFVPENAKIVRVQASVHPVPIDEKIGNWLAIGLGNPDDGVKWDGGFFLLVSAAGQYQAVHNSAGILDVLQGGDIPNYIRNGMNALRVEYNNDKHTISMYVNDVAVLSEYNVENMTFPTKPLFCGFSGYSQKVGNPAFSKFSTSFHQ